MLRGQSKILLKRGGRLILFEGVNMARSRAKRLEMWVKRALVVLSRLVRQVSRNGRLWLIWKVRLKNGISFVIWVSLRTVEGRKP